MRKTPTMQLPAFKQCYALAYATRRQENKKPVAHKLIETLKKTLSQAPQRDFNNNQQ